MDKARQIYLGTYLRIDYIDHLIKNFRMKYRCRKYYHSPMLHEMYIEVVFAYDMYL